MKSLNEQNRINKINGIQIHSCSQDSILQNMDENIKKKRNVKYISITNTESMYYALKDSAHLDYINNAEFSLCDGVGAVIGGKVQGKKIERYHGPDFMLHACEYGQDKKWRHFFCGGKEGVAEILVDNLREKFPQMTLAGIYCPPFREMTSNEKREMIKLIKESKPDIVWVGLGLLKQERWIAKYMHELQVPWSIGVGAAFDFYAGTVKRAPKIFQNIGLEWLYRLAKEPRMFKRNVNSLMFLLNVITDGINKRLKISN